MRDHDHVVVLTGIHEGYIEWDLRCRHEKDDARYYDPEYPNDCMVEEWHYNLGLELIDCATYVDQRGEVPLWTVSREYAEEPVLVGREQYIHHLEVHGPESEPTS